MLSEKELILSTKEFVAEDRVRSWKHLWFTLLLFIPSYIIILTINSWPLQLITSVFLGLLVVRLFIIYHDYNHKAILQNSIVADLIFKSFGLYILAPVSIWRRSHDYHHQNNSKLYTSSIGSFPIVTKSRYLEFSPKEKFYYLFIRHPLTILFGYIFVFFYGMAVLSFVRNPSKHWDSLVSIILHFGIAALIVTLFSWKILLFAFLIPNLISCALGSYLFYAQHNFPTVTFKDKNGWTYAYAALQSSSFMKFDPFMTWVTANIGYHHIHHLNSRIPFYRLPEAFSSMKELQNPKRTSIKLKDVISCLKLKVWDPEQEKMISLSEIYSR